LDRIDIAYYAKKEFTPPFISYVKYLYKASTKSSRKPLRNRTCDFGNEAILFQSLFFTHSAAREPCSDFE
jgi:hypothetical protein